jgi:nucleoside-diphosphate-sugar epimerase
MEATAQSRPVCAVTGANGYVGSRLVEALSADFHVVPMGRNAGTEGIRWTFGDVRVVDALKAHDVKVLVHSAWDMKETDPAKNLRLNVEGSAALFADAQAAGVERIVFISSISAFDNARSEYGRSKLAVEKITLDAGGTVVRPGLVWGESPGGMFSAVSRQVRNGGLVPMIGDGRYLQYLVHEDDLGEAVRRAAQGEYAGRVLTVAHPNGCMFRDLVSGMAARVGSKVSLMPVPWWLVYSGLKLAEAVGIPFGFRSDSVISLVYANPQPAFSSEIPVRPYTPAGPTP